MRQKLEVDESPTVEWAFFMAIENGFVRKFTDDSVYYSASE
jgi:hypothetical protein